jgi:hypothetical protein
VGLTQGLAGLGITHADFGRIAADALDDEVLANTARQPTAADIRSILLASDKELSRRPRGPHPHGCTNGLLLCSPSVHR